MSRRVALITGAGSGIGLAVARMLSDQYDTVWVDRDPSAADLAAGQNGLFVQADLSNRSACRQAVDGTIERFGRIDILVNNAGFQHISPIERFPEDVWEKMLAVMLTAPFLLTRYAWPHMQKQNWGRIINVSSIHGKVASPFKTGYISAKHGLIGLTRATALEGGEHGITVNAICPAYVRTPLVENQIADQAQARDLEPEAVISQVMLEPAAIKRLIEPDEVAALVAYLCSDAAAVVTGAAWDIDLGWMAR